NAYFDTYSTNADEFTDNDNNWTQQEHSANDDQMALDIHWALKEIYDYFDVEHRLQSFNDSNHMIDAFVHCELPDGFGGTTRDNAMFHEFANGDQVFFFGDGQTIFKPIGALDAVAHEFSHAITHNHTGWANLTTVRRAIHEGFSDIWGVVVENEVAPEKDHWKIGEEVIDVTGDDCLRNIQYPESSTSYTQIADCFGDTWYNDGGNDEAYEKSGVLSYWFYILSQGKTGTNDNDDNYIVYSLGLDVAAEIVLDGQTTEFASVSNYTDARDAMIDAADDIFGTNSFQSLQVANAWYAVGVGSNPGQVTLSGSSVICNAGTVITANSSPTGSTISWTCSNNLQVYSGGSTSTPTFKPLYTTSGGDGWVQVHYTSNGYTAAGPKKYVGVNQPYSYDLHFSLYTSGGTP
ncbi:MAG: M4 family metallopeptidase, partial [Clostridia bacterium]|nr:M4 family metallopeptidase [Clostridia bacterium]